ncbi:hypothetical protein BDV12DRAFT_207832 [Aspergillus spectabilis]
MAMENAKIRADLPVGNENYSTATVVIIGAGISGLCVAMDLLKRNKCKSFVILEKSSGLGGTWRDNKYPGCCCDVWSHLYSYSFAQNPDWSREYSGQEEILNYLVSVAHKYELYRYIRFNSSVERATWNNITQGWDIQVRVLGAKDAEFGEAYTINADFLVSAVGQLNIPHFPAIPGLSEYKGKMMHSARWDLTYDLTGKNVAVIGVGSTAAQIVPAAAKLAKSLTVFQRTPNWVAPRNDSLIPTWKRSLYRYLPYTRWQKRAQMMDFRESTFAALAVPTADRLKFFEERCRAHMEKQLPGREDLWKKLTPTYQLGCKRVISSDDYYPAFLRDNVRLETRRIDRVTAQGIMVEGEEETYDLIILATGFQTTDFMRHVEIFGKNGQSISSLWKDGAEALKGVCVKTLPNFGMMYGPNTNLSHNSVILMIEAQSRYINALIEEIIQAKLAGESITIQPNPHRVDGYNKRLQAELAKSSYADPNCDSWYKISSTGKITTNWSRTVVEYQELLSEIDWADFEVSGTGADRLRSKGTRKYVGRVKEESSGIWGSIGLVIFVVTALELLRRGLWA